MSDYTLSEHSPSSVTDTGGTERASADRPLHRVPLVGGWLRRRRAREERLPAFRRRVRESYDVDHLAATVVRKGIVDPSEDVVEALATAHLSRSLDAERGDEPGGTVPVAETERFVVHYGAAPNAPSAVSGPLWTLAREASYRQVRATFGDSFVEDVETDFEAHCRTLLEKGGWLVLAKPVEAWADTPEWSLTATRPPETGYGIRGTVEGSDVRRDYALTDGPLMCRTVRSGDDGESSAVLDTTALAPPDHSDPLAVWSLVAADFGAWRDAAAKANDPPRDSPAVVRTGDRRRRAVGSPDGDD